MYYQINNLANEEKKFFVARMIRTLLNSISTKHTRLELKHSSTRSFHVT